MEWKKDGYLITDSVKNIDKDYIITSLNSTYWAEKRSKELIIKSIENSVFLSLFDSDKNNKQIGFARIVSDYSCFAWICDVFIDKSYRGKGLGRFLMKSVVEHPSTQVSLKLLATKDAHWLYEKFGFKRTEAMIKTENKE